MLRSEPVEVEGFTAHSSVFNGASQKEIQERELTFEHSYMNKSISISEQNHIVYLNSNRYSYINK